MSGALHSAESVMHYTPKDIVQRAVDALGGEIMLDPASDVFGNETIRARQFYDKQGLLQPWHGPLFVNPPGRSDDNPGGASAWWHKLVSEWELASGSWSAIFVGFSLEILQTCQSKSYRHPLRFPTCVPKQRIKFDVSAVDLYRSLKNRLASDELMTEAKYAALRTKLAKVESAMKRGDTRFPGTSPTHGNFITCVTVDGNAQARFRTAFSPIGVVSGC